MIPRGHRAAFSKFRCGVAPIRVEIGRYERLALEDRHCFNCSNQVEDEEHVLLHCPIYQEIRQTLFDKIQVTVILCKNLTLKSYVSYLVTRMKILLGYVLSSVRKFYVYVEIVCINKTPSKHV